MVRWLRGVEGIAMDFSLHEQRRLAQIERDLSRTAGWRHMMGVLASDRPRPLRRTRSRLRCFAVTVPTPVARPGRRPWHAVVARLTFVAAIAVTLVAPPLLIASVIAGLTPLAIAATAAIPVAAALLVVSYRRTRRLFETYTIGPVTD